MTQTDAPPRIAYLTGAYPAVSHTFILREVEALRTLGADVITCAIRRPDASATRGEAEARAADTTFYVLQAARNPLTLLAAQAAMVTRPGRYFGALGLAWRTRAPGLRALLYQLFYFAEATVLARHLQAEGATRIHNHFADSSCTVAMLAGKLGDLPFSFTLHGPADFFAPERWRLDAKIARADFVACISHFCRAQAMIFAAPDDWPKLSIVHCGVDPARYATPPARDGSGRVLFVGRMAAVKGVPLLLDAFAEARADHPDARLVLVGDGPERPALEAHAARLGIGGLVEFTGALTQDAVAAEMARADLFVLPSFAEGVPVVLMEAMASGLPVIGPRVAGVPELVTDGESGLVLPPGSRTALVGAMRRLLSDADLRARMGRAGRARVAAEFDVAQEARRLLALFEGRDLPDGVPPRD